MVDEEAGDVRPKSAFFELKFEQGPLSIYRYRQDLIEKIPR
jgi:hypothetical protein